MLKWSYWLLSTVLFLSMSGSASAQEAQPKPSSTGKLQSKLITASAAADAIRFASLGELVHMRLQVIGASGDTLFDSDFKPGNLIDWAGSDHKGQRLADGSYLCVVSVKDSSGQVTRKHAIATLQNLSLALRESESALLSDAQAQAAGANADDDVRLTILAPAAPAATAVVAHDGATAHLVSGSGGLSISSGDFFANKLLEHMRLTVEGNLGIGTSNPQAKLDVVGLIRSDQGIVFPDGSIQYSASRKTFGAPSLSPGQSEKKRAHGEDLQTPAVDVTGTGTTGAIPKWLDGPAGELADSNITEVKGAIGINGEPSTNFRLDVNGSTRIRGSNPGFNLVGLRPAGNEWVFQTVDDDGRFRLFGQDNVNPGVERFTINLTTGNVGIGATTPSAKLDVAGDINASARYNLGGNPVMSLGAGVDNLFVGPSAGQSDPSGGANSFFGVSAGFNTTTGSSNSFFGRSAGFQNTTGADNSFFGVQAGRDNSTGTNNSFFGRGAGIGNSIGFDNSYFGAFAGQAASAGSANSFFGVSAGFNNTGTANSFFGRSAGFQNTSGGSNSFFGVQAGRDNSTGSFNSFFGRSAGQANSTGSGNAFFGNGAGQVNTTGSSNAFLGNGAGSSNTTGNSNVFLGLNTGLNNTTGGNNAFVGEGAGLANTTGSKNAFFGEGAGISNSTGTENTIIGALAGLGAGNLTNATAIGANALVSQSNSLVLGNNANVGIGTSSPAAKLQVEGGNQTGIFARADASRFAIFANGNVGQARDKSGWVKAMLLVSYTAAGATIVRCYDSTTNLSIPPCATIVSGSFGSSLTITFPFQVDDRFISLTPLNGEGISSIGNSSVTVSVGFSPGSFFIFVF